MRRHRSVRCEKVLVQLVRGPLHDGCVHPVLHCQHGTGCAPKLALQPLKQGSAQALRDHSMQMLVLTNMTPYGCHQHSIKGCVLVREIAQQAHRRPSVYAVQLREASERDPAGTLSFTRHMFAHQIQAVLLYLVKLLCLNALANSQHTLRVGDACSWADRLGRLVGYLTVLATGNIQLSVHACMMTAWSSCGQTAHCRVSRQRTAFMCKHYQY